MGEITSITGVFKSMKTYIEKNIKIPFSCIIFVVSVFFIFNHRLLSMINLDKWVPQWIIDILVEFGKAIYSNIIWVILAFLIFIAILVGITYLPTEKFFPKDVELVNGTTKSWNEYAALQKGINLFTLYLSTWWSYYFFFNILLNKHDFSKNFFILEKTNDPFLKFTNPIISSGYISLSNLTIMNYLFWINVLIAAYFLTQSLYQGIYKLPNDSIKYEYFDSYFEFNSKIVKNSIGEETQVSIFRYKYWDEAKYLLLEIPVKRNRLGKEPWEKEETYALRDVPLPKRNAKIILEDKELSNVIYAFENYKIKGTFGL